MIEPQQTLAVSTASNQRISITMRFVSASATIPSCVDRTELLSALASIDAQLCADDLLMIHPIDLDAFPTALAHSGLLRVQVQSTAMAKAIAQLKILSCKEATLQITEKTIVNDPIQWTDKKITPVQYAFHLISANEINVQLFDMNKYHGMLYTAIEDVDSKFADFIHNMHPPSIWNFGTFLPEKFAHASSAIKGDYTIPKHTRIMWRVSTIYPDIAERIAKIKELTFGRLGLYVESCIPNHLLPTVPKKLNAITIQISTPMVFFDRNLKQYLPIDKHNLVIWQCLKMRRANLLNCANMDEIADYVRILQFPSKRKGQTLTMNSVTTRVDGMMGFLTIKLLGDAMMKEHLYKLFYLSQFVGIGSNCNFGFGQNRIVHIQ